MHRITANGTTIACTIEGSGRTLLLLHGTASSSALWRPVAEALSSERMIVAPDLRGHGESPAWAADASPSLEVEARIVAALAMRFGGAIDVVGHSYGGAVALRLAAMMPRRIASLTLIEPAAFQLLHDRNDRDRALLSGITAIADSVARDVSGFVDFWNGPGCWAGLRPEKQAALRALAPTIRANFDAIFADPLRLSDCAALGVPTLLMAGDRSPRLTRRIVALLGMAMPHARTRLVEGAGHGVPKTHPVTVLQAIRCHLARVAIDPAPARRPIAA